jgi:chemotaxis protein CheD
MPLKRSQSINVVQGQYRISGSPDVVFTTILGSCVATCLYDPIACIGGINHFLVPGLENERSGELKYGINAMELLINSLIQNGATKSNLRIKLFGGAKTSLGRHNVGEANTNFARWFTENEGIPVTNQCIGGNLGRKIRFWPYSGRAQRLFLQSEQSATETPTAIEASIGEPRTHNSRRHGAVTLF